jgi:hypothetical protein
MELFEIRGGGPLGGQLLPPRMRGVGWVGPRTVRGVSTEPQGSRGGWLTYTNSSPSICRSVPLTRDDWRPSSRGSTSQRWILASNLLLWITRMRPA